MHFEQNQDRMHINLNFKYSVPLLKIDSCAYLQKKKLKLNCRLAYKHSNAIAYVYEFRCCFFFFLIHTITSISMLSMFSSLLRARTNSYRPTDSTNQLLNNVHNMNEVQIHNIKILYGGEKKTEKKNRTTN